MPIAATSPHPHFIGIGLQKAGTRWLYNQLQQHPDFWMPPIKELHFFDKPFPHRSALEKLADRRDDRSGRDDEFLAQLKRLKKSKTLDFAVYRSLFKLSDGLLTGDITPAYSRLDAQAIAAIATNLPTVKIILLLREPISRVWSNLNDAAAKGKVPEAVFENAGTLREVLRKESIRGLSFPSEIYCRWATYFGPERLQCFFLDDVIVKPEQTRAAILRYLGGDPAKLSGDLDLSHNPKSGRPRAELCGAVRALLIDEFHEELQRCAKLFGGPAADWPTKYQLS